MSDPERLAQYEIIEALAQGHSGWIFYKGFDPILRRNATLRAIPRRLLENYGTALVARLQSDVSAAARLHHPGIVGVFEYGEDSEWAFIATEFVEGGCLKEKSRLSVADSVSLIVQVLSALDFAHNLGIVHRDIKPSNLLINDKGAVRIANFGVAELNAGTRSYMAPEQLSGASADRRADLFSAGVIFYELLTGTSPFPDQPDGQSHHALPERERAPSEVQRDLPKSLDAVCAKALAKSVLDRYQTARSFSDSVRAAFETAFSAPPGRTVSNETMFTATFKRPQAEPDFGAIPRARDGLKPITPVAGSTQLDESTLRLVEKQLAVYLGPLARIIVKEAASKASDLEHLYKLAAESLKQEGDRRAFLSQRSTARPESGQNQSIKPPVDTNLPSKPSTADPGLAVVTPEVKSTPKPISSPAPLPHAKVVPAANTVTPPMPVNAQAHVGAKVPVRPDVQPVPKAEIKTVAKPDASIEKAKARPQLHPTPPATPNPVSRIEELIGQQPDTLAGYLHDDPAQLEEVIHALMSSLQALIAMHATGNKKEALTPQSICFDRLGKASIQTLQPAMTRGTSSGAGNPRYTAPEIFSEKSSGLDSTMVGAHVYALGVMFYEILLGKRLFGKTFADQRTDLDWLRWHADLESKPPQLKSLLPDYPVALSDLVESMMEKRAEKRPTDLESILSKLRSIAQRANKTVVLGKTGAKHVAGKAVSQAPSPIRKKSRKGLLVVLILILALGGIGFLLWQNPDFYRAVIAPLLHLGN